MGRTPLKERYEAGCAIDDCCFVPDFRCGPFQVRGWIVPAINSAADDHHSLTAQRHIGNAIQPRDPGQRRRCAFYVVGEYRHAASQLSGIIRPTLRCAQPLIVRCAIDRRFEKAPADASPGAAPFELGLEHSLCPPRYSARQLHQIYLRESKQLSGRRGHERCCRKA